MRASVTVTFAGKQAIVTGVGSGIGAALCRALAAAGADVVCTDLDEAAVARTAAPLGARSARLDVTDAAYPQMVRQGFGNIINTACRQGLPRQARSPAT
jgi:NAD(P)-dependent dehydrogenase (short-subunit alcohol dehydrogenase family)